jgi:hypothetical protein
VSNSKRLPRGGQPGTDTKHARGGHRRPSRAGALGSQTGATILAAGLAGAVMAIPATAYAATGSGGSASLAVLPAGGAAAVTAGGAATVTGASATAVLTAEIQGPAAAASPESPPGGASASGGTASGTSGVRDLFSQSTNTVSNFFNQVGTSFNNAMILQGQAEIANAQANEMLARGLVQAFPYAVQGMKEGFDTGIAAGTGIGVVVGGAVGAAGGTVAFPGVGTGTGLIGGGYVGGELGLIGGAGAGSAVGFIHGLVTAPTWQTLTMPSTAQDGAGQVTGLPDTGNPPQSMAGAAAPDTSMQDVLNRFGITANGQVLGSATTPAAWDPAVPGSQPSATQPPARQPADAQPPAGQPPATQPADAPSPVPPGPQGQADTGAAVAAGDPAAVTSPVQQPPDQQPPASDPALADATAGVQAAGPDQPAGTAPMVAMADPTSSVATLAD